MLRENTELIAGTVLDYSYQDLQEQSNRFANVLQQLGVKKCERVSALTGRIPPEPSF